MPKEKPLDRVMSMGHMMSNVLFNLGQAPQHVLTKNDCRTMCSAQRGWDAAVRAYRDEKAARREARDAKA